MMRKESPMNPNKQSTTFNYYFNITDKMKNFIKNSGTSPSVKFENRQDYQPIFDNKRQVGLTISSNVSQTEHEIADFSLTLPGYHFEGWKIVRDSHYVIPHNISREQAALYAGANSALHKTGISPEFLWTAGDYLQNVGKEYDLYAQWTPLEYEIRYSSRTINKVELSWTHPSDVRTVEKNFIPYLKPELRGYDFAGWTSIIDSTEQTIFEPYTIIPAGIGPVKLIALFEEVF